MSGSRRWSARKKAVVAAAFGLLLLAPLGITQQAEQPVVTGHSTFYNGNGFDPCLASVAGIMRTQVMWFNDQVLATRYGGKGTYVYITENGSDDPRGQLTLFSDGTQYDFTDPNGVEWNVAEYFWPTDAGVATHGTAPKQPAPATDRTYVWVVELSAFPIHDQFAGSPSDPNFHDVYNFLDIVDTCKFHRTGQDNLDPEHNLHYDTSCQCPEYNYNITHDNSSRYPDYLTPAHGHPYGTKPHTHETFLADIWMGGKPIVTQVGSNGGDAATWTSDWANGGPAPTQQGATDTAPNGGSLP